MNNGDESLESLESMSMFDLFGIEVESQASILNTNLLNVENDPESKIFLESLMRAAHSLKGAARMVGVDSVVKISHVMEDCFVAAQKNQIVLGRNNIDILLKSVDVIVEISSYDEESLLKWERDNAEHISQLVTALSNIVQAENSQQENVIPARSIVNVENVPSDNIAKKSDNDPVGDRSLRIDADRLSRILGMTGELLIESRILRDQSNLFYVIKRQQDEIMVQFEKLRDSQGEYSKINLDHQNSLLRQFDESRHLLSAQISSLDEYDRRNSILIKKLYHEVAGSRMRPFIDGASGFKRMVRDLSRSLNKEVDLVIKGKDTPVDRDILEKIKAPLNHLLRNAVDHGIEAKADRINSGKSEIATVTLSALHGGGMLKVTVEDDGAGINIDKLKSRLLAKGLVEKEILNQLNDTELLEFLFLPDFSTRDTVTEVSGRGVGLDVVREMVRELSGSVVIDNKYGKGVKFIMQLPLTLSVISTLLVKISGEPFAFPLSRVDKLIKVKEKDVKIVEGRQYVIINSENIGLISASHVLGLNMVANHNEELTVVIISDRLNQYGVVVDQFLGQKQLAVQAIDQRLGKIQNVNSASLMENGDPLFILDVDDMVRSIDHIVSGGTLGDVYQAAEKRLKSERNRILVVDDSLTVREVERDILKSYGYIVDVAVDGMDGWHAVRSNNYDLIITDVDMPRMDGIGLVKAIKNDPHLKSLPIMIVSYKDRGEDRRRGLDAGADYYLAKGSFHDDALIEAVTDLIGNAIK